MRKLKTDEEYQAKAILLGGTYEEITGAIVFRNVTPQGIETWRRVDADTLAPVSHNEFRARLVEYDLRKAQQYDPKHDTKRTRRKSPLPQE